MKKLILFIAVASLVACKKNDTTPKPFDVTYNVVYQQLIPGVNDTLQGCTMRVWEDGNEVKALVSAPANYRFSAIKTGEGSAASSDGKTHITYAYDKCTATLTAGGDFIIKAYK